MKSYERIFTIKDLRELLKLSKNVSNNKTIINGLIWLQKLGLIEYDISVIKDTNVGTKVSLFELKAVNYYTNGGEATTYIGTEGRGISEDLKNTLLNEEGIEIFE